MSDEKSHRTSYMILNKKMVRQEIDQAVQTDDSRVENTTTRRMSNAAINEGDQLWLIMKHVNPRLKQKLGHRWYGTFRAKKQVEEFAFELEFPDRSGYRFYPVIDLSRFEKVTGQGERPTTKLVHRLGKTDRLDVDEEILPEGS